jgi:ubiquinone/menaquinone biosynthesis C-methylase UbiE
MSKNTQSTGAKPAGFSGRIAGRVMNLIHAGQYKRIIKQILNGFKAGGPLKILDIGCGGGKAIKLFCALAENPKVYGLDHSPEMAALAKRVNKRGVACGNVEIVQGDVAGLPYPDGSFDIVSAFDTVNFWTDFEGAMREVIRVLKKSGMFLIVNGYPKEGTKWWDFVRFKTADEYRGALAGHGFKGVKTEIQKNTIVIRTYKK